jgi:hypothetical protein
MTQPGADIAHERRRMMQIRRALRALLDCDPNSVPELSAAYLACTDYLVYSMNRLHAQDQGIHDRLRDRIPATDVEAHARLADLQAQQCETRALIDDLSTAADLLRRSTDAGLAGFAGIFRWH